MCVFAQFSCRCLQIDVAGLPCMDDLLGRHVDLTKVKKIGEGTFGEAFKAGNLVLKIVPMEGSILVSDQCSHLHETFYEALIVNGSR